jgi:leucine-zipper-like transcriptional regulator 1
MAPRCDSRATLATVADYAIANGSNLGPSILVSAQRFNERIGHAAVFFKNRYWLIGGGVPVLPGVAPVQHVAKADVWSSADGRTWRRETSDGGFGARWFHRAVVFNDRIWIISGAPAPVINPSAPWYDDVWSSADGLSWRHESNQSFPWRSTDLKVVVFNNEMLVVSGGRVYSSTTGTFTPKVAGDPVLLTGTSQGRTHATVYNNELWYIGGKLDLPINMPPSGDTTNDVWKSPDGITWTRVVEHAPFSPRYRHSSFVANGKLWVLGGQDARGGVAGLSGRAPTAPIGDKRSSMLRSHRAHCIRSSSIETSYG